VSLFASLRSRLLASYIFVVVLSLLAAALALTYLLQGYREQLTLARLTDVAVPVSVQVRTWLREGNSPEAIVAYLSEQTNPTSVRVLLLNRNGMVLQDTAGESGLRGQQFTMPELPPVDIRLPQGGRFAPPGSRPLLYAMVPIVSLLPRPDQNTVAYVVLAQPEYLGQTIAELVPRMLVAGVVALFAAVLIAVAMANSLYLPIRRLRGAAEGMSRGDYAQRVAVGGPRELAELATSFNRMASEVQRSRQVLRDFVADVSHELKTPLTAIRGFTQAMGDGTVADDEGRRRALGVVDAEARRLQGLVAQLLDLSRIEAGQVTMASGVVPVGELVERCREIFALRAGERGVQVATAVAPALAVTGDADRLEQLLNNLLDNAIGHTPPGGCVEVSARLKGEMVEVAVGDTGPGIPAEELPRVFERFYTGRAGKGGGIGLGLAISRQIARAHGGDIVAHSATGAGSVFVVTLPAHITPAIGPRLPTAEAQRLQPG
jgi:signal transduction histidine kinase